MSRRNSDPRLNGGSPIFSRVVQIPGEQEHLEWTALLRADLPEYVSEQIRAAAFHLRCTQISLILKGIASLRDSEGRPLFHIRSVDLVPDRRKGQRSQPGDGLLRGDLLNAKAPHD